MRASCSWGAPEDTARPKRRPQRTAPARLPRRMVGRVLMARGLLQMAGAQRPMYRGRPMTRAANMPMEKSRAPASRLAAPRKAAPPRPVMTPAIRAL